MSTSAMLAPAMAKRPHSPARLLFAACVWLPTCMLAPVPLMVAALWLGGSWPWGEMENLGQVEWFALLGVLAAGEFALVAVSWCKARRIGFGDRALGLGFGPIARLGRIWGLTAGMVAYVAVQIWLIDAVPAVRVMFEPSSRFWSALAEHGGVAVRVGFAVVVVALAPVAEETFFRGWLWVGLRRRWSAGATGLVTGALFLAAHLGEGWAKPMLLIPCAVALSLARHYGGSVRASILAHMVYNGVVMLVGLAFRLAGD